MPYKDPAKQLEYIRKRRASQTPEERAEYNKQCSEYQKEHRAERSEYQRKWIAANRTKKVAYSIKGNRKWRKNNPEEAKRRDAEQFQKHRPKRIAKVKEWRKSNQELRSHYNATRRARKFGNGGEHSYQQWIEKVISLNWLCFYCGAELTIENLSKDHFIPLSRGGGDGIDNLVPACHLCNCSKSAMTGDEFLSHRKVTNKSK